MAELHSIPQVEEHQRAEVLAACQVLEDKLTEAVLLVSCLESLAGDQPPDWLFLFSSAVRGIDQASEGLGVLVRRASV